MSSLLLIAAYLASLNPMRTRLGVPEDDQGGARMGVLGAGTGIGVLALALLAAASNSFLDALEVSPETFRIAAGFVLVIVAAWMIFVPVPAPEPTPGGAVAALWPVAYPRVISPETVTLALSTGASDGLGLTVLGLVVAGAVLVAVGSVRAGPVAGSVMASVGRVFAVVLVLIGIWLAIQGVREV